MLSGVAGVGVGAADAGSGAGVTAAAALAASLASLTAPVVPDGRTRISHPEHDDDGGCTLKTVPNHGSWTCDCCGDDGDDVETRWTCADGCDWDACGDCCEEELEQWADGESTRRDQELARLRAAAAAATTAVGSATGSGSAGSTCEGGTGTGPVEVLVVPAAHGPYPPAVDCADPLRAMVDVLVTPATTRTTRNTPTAGEEEVAGTIGADTSITDEEGDESHFKLGPRGMEWWANGWQHEPRTLTPNP
jgi:hypothetical protein